MSFLRCLGSAHGFRLNREAKQSVINFNAAFKGLEKMLLFINI